MTIQEIIYKILSEDQMISNIIGDKIYPLTVSQGKMIPFVTYTVESMTPNSGKGEISVFDTYRIEIDIFSDKYSTLNNLTNLIRGKFEAFTYFENNIFCEFDFITLKESYENDAQLYNITVIIIGHYNVN